MSLVIKDDLTLSYAKHDTMNEGNDSPIGVLIIGNDSPIGVLIKGMTPL